MLEAGLLTGIGACWILSRMNLRRVAGYALFWDVFLTVLFIFMFLGTYAGMVTGMVAGLVVSLFLTLVKKTAGVERVRFKRKKGQVFGRPGWN